MPRKILIVEDNELDREMLSTILSPHYTILEAKDGDEALNVLLHHAKTISAVLLDMIMPGIDGFEVLRRISKNALWNQIPTIVTTALTDEIAQETAIELGATGFTVKPYNPSLLLHSLYNCIHMRENAAMVNNMRRDKLSGLYNRETFFQEAERMIKRNEPGYYLLSCFDIDNFRVLNDQYGTEIGDAVLVHVSDCIRNCLGKIDGIACRFAADQFAILYPEEYKNSKAIQEVHDLISVPPCLNQTIKLRIGRYLVENPALEVSAMVDRATLAEESIRGIYGANIAEYNASMRDHLIVEQQIVTKMHAALLEKQFNAWLQPQYNHATGALIGAEALVRWIDPEQGRIVPPSDFVPVFERNGFIYEVDKCVWEQVCLFLRKQIDSGKEPIPISVNISRCDMFAPDFLSFITDLVKTYDIPINLLRLEVTESAFSSSPEQIISTTKKLVETGFTVEIDDFGSGYSSLNSLKDVPADVLKLDMKFFENSEDSNRAGNIIESVIRMAKWLGMAVIAEGVETKEQADYLQSIGCVYIQGYYYAKPMPIADFEQLLEGGNKSPVLDHIKTITQFDANSFWNPSSIESLIFNSYVGGACILEYNSTTIEVVRKNERYSAEFDNRTINGILVADISPEACLDSMNLQIMQNSIHQAISTGNETTFEVNVTGLDGSADKPLFLRCSVRLIAQTEDRYLLYATIYNISEIRIAELREKAHLNQLDMLNNIAQNMLAQPNMDQNIVQVVSDMIAYFNGEHAYVIEFTPDKKAARVTYETYLENMPAPANAQRDISPDELDRWITIFSEKDFIAVENIAKLDKEHTTEKKLLDSRHITSLVASPLKRNGEIIGIAAIDNPELKGMHIGRLSAIGSYIAIMITLRDK